MKSIVEEESTSAEKMLPKAKKVKTGEHQHHHVAIPDTTAQIVETDGAADIIVTGKVPTTEEEATTAGEEAVTEEEEVATAEPEVATDIENNHLNS